MTAQYRQERLERVRTALCAGGGEYTGKEITELIQRTFGLREVTAIEYLKDMHRSGMLTAKCGRFTAVNKTKDRVLKDIEAVE